MNHIHNIVKYCKHAAVEVIYAVLGAISPKSLVSLHYRRAFRKKLNWDDPKDINEKINWQKFHSDTSKWVELADKYRVRQYIEKAGFGDMLVKLYGKWDKAEDIDWESLPNTFVMKVNNGSGDVLVCRDKKAIDTKEWTAYFSKLLQTKFGHSMGEPHYDKIKPCIIAEELLDNKQQQFTSSSIADYKIWTFDGVPAYIWVCFNRTKHSTDVAVYDLEWNFHPEYSISNSHYVLTDKNIPRPKSLEKMLEAAAKISKGFPQMRFDCYEVGGKAYFGEITMSSAAGFNDFYTDEFLRILGDKAKLK